MAIEQFGIPSLLLMENAGRGVADIVSKESARFNPEAVSVLVCCGKGNNGGDGLVAARHLKNRGFKVQVLLFANPASLKEDPALNFNIVTQMKIPGQVILQTSELNILRQHLEGADYVIDALFGVGLNSDLKEPYASAVEVINEAGKKVIAVDIPSGLDADTGQARGNTVSAAITATLGIAKKGLYEREGPLCAGQIYVVDIGLPKEIL
jgi:NAD(P)H-hydrate epimerase